MPLPPDVLPERKIDQGESDVYRYGDDVYKLFNHRPDITHHTLKYYQKITAEVKRFFDNQQISFTEKHSPFGRIHTFSLLIVPLDEVSTSGSIVWSRSKFILGSSVMDEMHIKQQGIFWRINQSDRGEVERILETLQVRMNEKVGTGKIELVGNNIKVGNNQLVITDLYSSVFLINSEKDFMSHHTSKV